MRSGTGCRSCFRTQDHALALRRRQDVLLDVLTQLANDLPDECVIDERESFIDASFAFAKGGGNESARPSAEKA